jgi:RHS repeat-associated protein
VSYVRDPDGQLIGIRVGTSTNATRYYFTFDGLGSITGLTDSTGARVNTYRYDPYGQQLSAVEGLPQPFRYTGGIHDTATGLTKLGIRYYEPALGRFTQPDPTGQDPHYTYARNNPVNNVDPSGGVTFGVNYSVCVIFCHGVHAGTDGVYESGAPCCGFGGVAAGVYYSGRNAKKTESRFSDCASAGYVGYGGVCRERSFVGGGRRTYYAGYGAGASVGRFETIN